MPGERHTQAGQATAYVLHKLCAACTSPAFVLQALGALGQCQCWHLMCMACAGGWVSADLEAYVCPNATLLSDLKQAAVHGNEPKIKFSFNPQHDAATTPAATRPVPVFSMARLVIADAQVVVLRAYPAGWQVHMRHEGQVDQLLAVESARPSQQRIVELVLTASAPASVASQARRQCPSCSSSFPCPVPCPVPINTAAVAKFHQVGSDDCSAMHGHTSLADVARMCGMSSFSQGSSYEAQIDGHQTAGHSAGAGGHGDCSTINALSSGVWSMPRGALQRSCVQGSCNVLGAHAPAAAVPATHDLAELLRAIEDSSIEFAMQVLDEMFPLSPRAKFDNDMGHQCTAIHPCR